MVKNSPQNVLVVGSGGREHALGWKLSQSMNIGKLYFAPGNAGTDELGQNVDISDTDVDGIVSLVDKNSIDLTVVGPERSLEVGLVDALAKEGRAVFGPSAAAAKLETSKAFAGEFVEKYSIPHPRTSAFSDPDEAIAFVKEASYPLVIKASGLASGKGVFLPDSLDEAVEKIRAISDGAVNGKAGDQILIQERLSGREASIIAISDGTTVVSFIPAQDYKRAYDGGIGPNTGGMGSFAPSEMTPQLMDEIHKTILKPTIDGMVNDRTPYKGVLYAGLMLTADGPKVIEYNARFGDPETQPLMTMLDSDLLAIMQASVNGNLTDELVKFKKGASVCVVLAEKGYPGSYKTGHEIHGLKMVKGNQYAQVFHAGTVKDGNKVLSSGGRVLGVMGYGQDLAQAITQAYSIVGKGGVWFEGMEWRKDIGR